jgi:hypothetical protein
MGLHGMLENSCTILYVDGFHTSLGTPVVLSGLVTVTALLYTYAFMLQMT